MSPSGWVIIDGLVVPGEPLGQQRAKLALGGADDPVPRLGVHPAQHGGEVHPLSSLARQDHLATAPAGDLLPGVGAAVRAQRRELRGLDLDGNSAVALHLFAAFALNVSEVTTAWPTTHRPPSTATPISTIATRPPVPMPCQASDISPSAKSRIRMVSNHCSRCDCLPSGGA